MTNKEQPNYQLIDINALSTMIANDQFINDTKGLPEDQVYDMTEQGKIPKDIYAEQFFMIKGLWTQLIMEHCKK